MKKTLFVLSLFCFGISLNAQQLTRFAVIDMPKVYTAFFRDSRAVRELEERSARVQTEIDRMNNEIQKLRSAYVEAQAQGDNERALRLENEMYRRSEFLKEYFQTKTAELEDQKSRLARSNTFLQQVMDEIKYIAESEGYTLVLNLKENTGIIWFSQTVDITEKVIQNLMSKAGR